MNSIINFSVKLTQKYLPDAYILAILLTVMIFFSGIIFAGQSPIEMSNHWGEGFTEWDNIRNAKPEFEGHNQPRVPLNNNYYN